jgi:hypothetical protein
MICADDHNVKQPVETAQVLQLAAHEESKWPRRPPSTAELTRHLKDQHGLTRADMVPILGTSSRVSEVLRGKKELSMTMLRQLRARCRPIFLSRCPGRRGAGQAWLRPESRSYALGRASKRHGVFSFIAFRDISLVAISQV